MNGPRRRRRCDPRWRWLVPAAGVLALLWTGVGCSPPIPAAGAGDPAAEARERAGEPGVTLVNDREGDAFVVVIGPVTLPAGDDHAGEGSGEGSLDEPTHHGAHAPVWPPLGEVTVPVDAEVHGFEWSLSDAGGHELPTEVLHHVNVIDPTHRELFLPISRRLAAAGEETGPVSLPPFLLGIPVRRGQPLVISAMLHNPTGERHEGVVLTLRLPYVEAPRPWPLFRVHPFQLDVAFPAGDKSFDLPPGRSVRTYEARPAVAGRIVGIGGHLHEHGTRIGLEDATTGEVLWQARPVVEESGSIDHVPQGHLYRSLGVPITPDHAYRVSVTYENPTGDTIPRGGMGVVGGVFLPDGPWPEADRGDPLYVLDRKHYLREVYGTFDEIDEVVGGLERRRDTGRRGALNPPEAR